MSTNMRTTKSPQDATPSTQKNDLLSGTLSVGTRWGILVASILAGAGLVVFLAGTTNFFAMVVVCAIVYAIAIYVIARAVEGPRQAMDRLVTAVVTTMFLLAIIPLISLLVTVVSRGWARMDVEFFTYSMRGVVGEGGGIYHALVGTLIVTLIASLIAVPVGILTAIYMVEYGNNNRLSRALTFFVDVMTGIPSIVAGLFAYSLFALIFGPGARAGIIGSVALSVLMIPLVVRNTEEMLRVVPMELREAAYALGVPKWLTIVKVVLRTAVAGIATGVTIAIARIIGETAPLLVTVGITTSTNLNPFEGRMATLPVFSYYQFATPGVPPDPYIERSWAAALVLVMIVMILNLLARFISQYFAPKSR